MQRKQTRKEGKTSNGTPARAMQRKHTHAHATNEGKHKKCSASARHATTQRHANAHAQQTEANAKIAHGKNRSARQKNCTRKAPNLEPQVSGVAALTNQAA